MAENAVGSMTESNDKAASARVASCPCGQLSVACQGEPGRVSVCHCLDCQRRSGSVFAAQARFPVERVQMTGRAAERVRVGDNGAARFHFCPDCGAIGWYTNDSMPGLIAVPIGNFADPDFPAPSFSVFENRKHAWVQITGDGIEHD
ncbi:GFA family protein [Sphingomonas sp. MMS12-HWE2-04]|uniref:GFA family protein n=1 Tax=Sphingomonas sp. MMS12-HWE2-04 TaxID=3234199 RepID=UPI00384C256D